MSDEKMSDPKRDRNEDVLIDALSALLRVLLQAMDGLNLAARRLHPTNLTRIAGDLEGLAQNLSPALATFQAQPWPPELTYMSEAVNTAAAAVKSAFSGLQEAAGQTDGMFHAYRALRFAPRAAEALYPLAGQLPVLSQYFLDEPWRHDQDLISALSLQKDPGHNTGVLHANNQKHERGGFSLYIPENYDPAHAYPVIIALHGGSGHGRAFLWTWLRQARSRGAILLSPTSLEGTWSLMQPERDARNIRAILDMVGKEWHLDKSRLLLTGMSDGGTFSYLCGGATGVPYTHLAPISASFQPMLLEFLDKDRLRGLPLYLVHGALDWMFPIDIARTARASLGAAGVDLVYREIADLSHTYPIEENSAIMDWFLSGTKPAP